MSRASISLPSGTLAGTYYTGPNNPAFAVVWAHGFGSHRGGEKSEAVQAECADRGWTFAAFDFRGHGASSGTMRELRASRLLEDLAAVRDWLAERGHPRLGLVGSSMGGFASAWFAKTHPEAVLGCVLLAPAFGFLDRRWDNLTPDERDEWRTTGRRRVKNDWVDVEVGYGLVEERDRFAPRDLVRNWRTPSLLFHGLADDTVPDTDSLFFIRHVEYPRVELRLLKDGDHRLTAHKAIIAAAAGGFFADLLEARAQGAPT
jgi:pimeloyl-ACP methyl ester carboxylesterase